MDVLGVTRGGVGVLAKVVLDDLLATRCVEDSSAATRFFFASTGVTTEGGVIGLEGSGAEGSWAGDGRTTNSLDAGTCDSGAASTGVGTGAGTSAGGAGWVGGTSWTGA